MITTDEVKYKTYRGILKPSQKLDLNECYDFYNLTFKGIKVVVEKQEVIWLVDEDSNEDGLFYINKEEFAFIEVESEGIKETIYQEPNQIRIYVIAQYITTNSSDNIVHLDRSFPGCKLICQSKNKQLIEFIFIKSINDFGALYKVNNHMFFHTGDILDLIEII